MKYVEAGAGDFYKFFKKYFVAQGTIKLNISLPSNFVEKYFMDQDINFSFLYRAYILIFQGSIHSNIQIIKGVNIHNNIQKIIIIKQILQKFSNIFFAASKFISIKIISRKFNFGSSTINQLNWVYQVTMTILLKREKQTSLCSLVLDFYLPASCCLIVGISQFKSW